MRGNGPLATARGGNAFKERIFPAFTLGAEHLRDLTTASAPGAGRKKTRGLVSLRQGASLEGNAHEKKGPIGPWESQRKKSL